MRNRSCQPPCGRSRVDSGASLCSGKANEAQPLLQCETGMRSAEGSCESAIRPVLEGGHIHDDFASFHEDSESVETTRPPAH